MSIGSDVLQWCVLLFIYFPNSWAQGSGNTADERVKRSCEPGHGEECSNMVHSEHDRAAAPMRSLQLCLPA